MFCSSSDSSDQFYVYMLQCVLQHDHRHRWMMLSNRDLSFPVIPLIRPGGQMPVKMSVQAAFTRAVGVPLRGLAKPIAVPNIAHGGWN